MKYRPEDCSTFVRLLQILWLVHALGNRATIVPRNRQGRASPRGVSGAATNKIPGSDFARQIGTPALPRKIDATCDVQGLPV